MSDQNIKSRPKYSPLKPNPLAKFTLILSEFAMPDANPFAEGVKLSDFNEHWIIAGHSKAIPSVEYNGICQEFRSIPHMLTALNVRLAAEKMGFYLYAVGSEPFLGEVNNVAAKYCMSRDEIYLFAVGSQARRVYCVHCQVITEKVKTNVFQCSACGANLFVRDHFSKRLNAFAGVQVDAEVPGEIPEIEELYL